MKENIVSLFVETFNLNVFQKKALLKADFSDEKQIDFIICELKIIGIDSLSISGFLEDMKGI